MESMNGNGNEVLQMLLGEIREIKQGQERLEAGQQRLEKRHDELSHRLDVIESDIQEIKENAIITRHSANLLLCWTEKADNVLNIGLYERQEA